MAHGFSLAQAPADPFPEIEGRSQEIRALKHHLARVGLDADVTVLILGESGTGKGACSTRHSPDLAAAPRAIRGRQLRRVGAGTD